MNAFTHTIENEGDRPVARLGGDIDLAAVTDLEDAIKALEGGSGRDVAIDMSGVTFLDSSGLRVLVAAHNRHEEAGRRLVLESPSPPVTRILEITGLLSTLHVAD